MDEYGYVVNVDVAVVRDGDVLIIERAASEDHAGGMLSFPGGKMEDPPAGEDAIAATARREVREETGVEISDVQYTTSGTFVADTGNEVLNVVTRADFVEGEPRVRDPEEVSTVQWMDIGQLRAQDDIPGFLLEYVDAVLAALDGG